MTPQCSRRDFIKKASAGALAACCSRFGDATTMPFPGQYQPTWDSLSQYRVPDWYRDAKFGVFLHWGIYSVPAYLNEWYPRFMYRRESPAFEWHQQHWGPQSMFGYKDFIPLFRGEKWRPEEWVELFKQAGARFIVPVGEHHDGFPMYRSNLTEWCAARMGPCRDVVGELAQATRDAGLRLGISSHRGFHWSYYTFAEDFDTNNPAYAGLYGPIHAPMPLVSDKKGELRQKASPEFLQDWFARSIEIVDSYRPDLFYFDFAMEAPEFEPYRRQFAAYFYNRAIDWNGEPVLTYKHDSYPEGTAVLDIERGLLAGIRSLPWQTDTSVSWKSWGYIQNDSYKSGADIVHELADIVSKNGTLLLNVGPRPDGTIPEAAQAVFREIGRWLEINGEAIYGTRPWKVYGEGPTHLSSGSFGEEKAKGQVFTSEDIRFTTRDDAIYAIVLAWPETSARIKSLGKNSGNAPARISDVRLLGADAKLNWQQDTEALVIQAPAEKSGDLAWAFKISM